MSPMKRARTSRVRRPVHKRRGTSATGNTADAHRHTSATAPCAGHACVSYGSPMGRLTGSNRYPLAEECQASVPSGCQPVCQPVAGRRARGCPRVATVGASPLIAAEGCNSDGPGQQKWTHFEAVFWRPVSSDRVRSPRVATQASEITVFQRHLRETRNRTW